MSEERELIADLLKEIDGLHRDVHYLTLENKKLRAKLRKSNEPNNRRRRQYNIQGSNSSLKQLRDTEEH